MAADIPINFLSEDTSQYEVFLLFQEPRQHMFLTDLLADEKEIVYFNEVGLSSFYFPPITPTSEHKLSFEVIIKNQQYCRIGVAISGALPLPVFGVGGAAGSFGLDPLNGLFWKEGVQSQFGEPCASGDRIRCVVKNGEISFWKNGEFMGVAVRNICESSKVEYVPVFTCGRFQCLGFRKEPEGSIKLYKMLVGMRDEQRQQHGLRKQQQDQQQLQHRENKQILEQQHKQQLLQLHQRQQQQSLPLQEVTQLQQLLSLQMQQLQQLHATQQQEIKKNKQQKRQPQLDPNVKKLHFLAFFGKQPSEEDVTEDTINVVTAGWATPLMWACAMHNNSMVEFLLKRQCNTEVYDRLGCSVVEVAAAGGNWKVMQRLLWEFPHLIRAGSGFSLVYFCSLFGHYATLVELLKHPLGRQFVNSHFPLHTAAANNHYYICLLLLDNGADRKLQRESVAATSVKSFSRPDPKSEGKQKTVPEFKSGREKNPISGRKADPYLGSEADPELD